MHDVASFDRLARLYDLGARFLSVDAASLEDALALAERPIERVLDVGGGTGRAARALPVSPVVVDAAPGMLARARAAGLEGVCGDARRLPVRDESVDAVVVVDALHHVRGTEGAVREASRVLRRGGVLVVREYDPTTLPGRLLETGEHLVGFDSHFLAPDDLAAVFATTGLRPAVTDRGFGYTVAGVRESGET